MRLFFFAKRAIPVYLLPSPLLLNYLLKLQGGLALVYLINPSTGPIPVHFFFLTTAALYGLLLAADKTVTF